MTSIRKIKRRATRRMAGELVELRLPFEWFVGMTTIQRDQFINKAVSEFIKQRSAMKRMA